jgi:hypothetical protein
MAACGGSAKSSCELAQEKLVECRAQIDERGNRLRITIGDDCTGVTECLSKCMDHANCAALAYALAGGGSADPNSPPGPADGPPVLACILACVDG